MRLLCAAIVWLVLALPTLADIAAPTTQSDTLRVMRDSYSATPQITNVIVDFDERYISFQVNGADPQISFPDNLHSQLQQASTDNERQAIMDRYLQTVLQTAQALQKDAPVNIANVYPVLRHHLYFKGADADHAAHGDHAEEDAPQPPVLSFPFVADMRIFLIEDAPQFVKYLTKADLEALGMTADALKEQAFSNISAKAAELNIEGNDGLYLLIMDGSLETSFLVDTALWQTVDSQIGTIVAVVAARDLVLFVDGDIPTAVDDLRDVLAAQDGQISYPVSTTLITWKDGRWVDY